MKKLLVLVFTFSAFLAPVFSQVTLNETKVSSENYERLAKCFKPEDFSRMVSEKIKADEDIFALTNDFELVESLGQNAGAYRFLYAVFKQQKEMTHKTVEAESEFDFTAETLRVQKLFYKTLEDLTALTSDAFKNQQQYVDYVFSDSVNSAELAIFDEAKNNVASGLVLVEPSADVPVYSLNEIVGDFKNNEIAAQEKWVGKQVKMTASIYSIYQLDYNTVFNIESQEKLVVPVMRLNSGSQTYANCFFNNENVGKIAKYRKNNQVTVVGIICQDIARRPSFKNCKIVEK